MDDWKNGRVVNRERFGERVVWKKEKVKKWEMPSCTHTGKSTDPPSHCLAALEFKVPEGSCLRLGDFQEEHVKAPSRMEHPTHHRRSY